MGLNQIIRKDNFLQSNLLIVVNTKSCNDTQNHKTVLSTLKQNKWYPREIFVYSKKCVFLILYIENKIYASCMSLIVKIQT